MIERDVEKYLCDVVTRAGGICDKTVSPGSRGFFDRVVVLPGGRIVFVEVKKPRGGRISAHQRRRHVSYRSRGAEVAVVKSAADVDALVTAGVHQSSGSSDTG